MSALYWEIGNRINQDLLKEQRAEYGKQIVSQLAKQLQAEYGSNNFSEKNLRRMMQFASVFPDRKIVATLLRQFSWSHFTLFIPIQDGLKRSFYMEMCRLENWIVFMLKGIEVTANETVILIHEIKKLMQDYKMKIRPLFGTKYNHELLNNLFRHPYTKIEYIMRDLEVSRLTATKYLEEIVSARLAEKVKIGKSNYYINQQLVELFINQADLHKKHV